MQHRTAALGVGLLLLAGIVWRTGHDRAVDAPRADDDAFAELEGFDAPAASPLGASQDFAEALTVPPSVAGDAASEPLPLWSPAAVESPPPATHPAIFPAAYDAPTDSLALPPPAAPAWLAGTIEDGDEPAEPPTRTQAAQPVRLRRTYPQ